MCNATEDDTFDVSQFLSNSSYFENCDCVIFKNCTNETVIIPPSPIVPVPPLPPSGSLCNYTCDEIRNLHIVIENLTDIITAQQDSIDMLIAQF